MTSARHRVIELFIARAGKHRQNPLMGRRIILSLVAFSLALPVAARAQDIPCDMLQNRVYMQIGDTQEPLMKRLARRLRDSATKPITIIYLTSGSCTNIDAIYNRTALTMNPKYVPSTAEDPAWTASMPSKTCTLDAAGVPLDIANSAVFLEICTETPVPEGITAYQGPIQPYVFAVSNQSSQRAITAEEAYFVFGFPNGGMVEPWTDETTHFIRTNTKSTLLALAANINVPASKWKGMRFDKSTEVVDALANAANPEKAIGILGAEVLDQNRDKLKALAFQAYGQKHAYYPDSTPTATDRQNTRDGHYVPWSPTIYLTPTTGGVPNNPDAKYVIDLILGNTVDPNPGFDSIDVVVEVGLVPSCAMKVTRDREGGELSKYSPAEPCHCYFESQVGTAPASCTACTDNSTCGAGTCRHGFCEGGAQ